MKINELAQELRIDDKDLISICRKLLPGKITAEMQLKPAHLPLLLKDASFGQLTDLTPEDSDYFSSFLAGPGRVKVEQMVGRISRTPKLTTLQRDIRSAIYRAWADYCEQNDANDYLPDRNRAFLHTFLDHCLLTLPRARGPRNPDWELRIATELSAGPDGRFYAVLSTKTGKVTEEVLPGIDAWIEVGDLFFSCRDAENPSGDWSETEKDLSRLLHCFRTSTVYTVARKLAFDVEELIRRCTAAEILGKAKGTDEFNVDQLKELIDHLATDPESEKILDRLSQKPPSGLSIGNLSRTKMSGYFQRPRAKRLSGQMDSLEELLPGSDDDQMDGKTVSPPPATPIPSRAGPEVTISGKQSSTDLSDKIDAQDSKGEAAESAVRESIPSSHPERTKYAAGALSAAKSGDKAAARGNWLDCLEAGIEIASDDYGCFALAAGKTDQGELLREIWSHWCESDVPLTSDDYGCFAESATETDQGELLREVWSHFCESDVPLTSDDYGRFAWAAVETDQGELVREVWSRLCESDVRLTSDDYGCFGLAAGKTDQGELLREVWAHCRKAGIEIASNNYGCFAWAAGEAEEGELVREVWSRLCESDVRLTSDDYGCFGLAAGKTDQGELVGEVWSRCLKAGVSIDARDYGRFALAAGETKEGELVREVWSRLWESDVRLTFRHYRSFALVAMETDQGELLGEIWSRWCESDVPLTSDDYGCFALAAGKTDQGELLGEIWSHWCESDVPLTSDNYGYFTLAAGNTDQGELLREVWSRWCESDVPLTSGNYLSFAWAAGEAKEGELVREVWSRLCESDVPLTSDGYGRFAEAAGKTDQGELLGEIWSHWCESDVPLTSDDYGRFAASATETDQGELVREVWSHWYESDVPLTSDDYGRFAAAARETDQGELLREVWSRCLKAGVSLDARDYRTFALAAGKTDQGELLGEVWSHWYESDVPLTSDDYGRFAWVAMETDQGELVREVWSRLCESDVRLTSEDCSCFAVAAGETKEGELVGEVWSRCLKAGVSIDARDYSCFTWAAGKTDQGELGKEVWEHCRKAGIDIPSDDYGRFAAAAMETDQGELLGEVWSHFCESDVPLTSGNYLSFALAAGKTDQGELLGEIWSHWYESDVPLTSDDYGRFALAAMETDQGELLGKVWSHFCESDVPLILADYDRFAEAAKETEQAELEEEIRNNQREVIGDRCDRYLQRLDFDRRRASEQIREHLREALVQLCERFHKMPDSQNGNAKGERIVAHDAVAERKKIVHMQEVIAEFTKTRVMSDRDRLRTWCILRATESEKPELFHVYETYVEPGKSNRDLTLSDLADEQVSLAISRAFRTGYPTWSWSHDENQKRPSRLVFSVPISFEGIPAIVVCSEIVREAKQSYQEILKQVFKVYEELTRVLSNQFRQDYWGALASLMTRDWMETMSRVELLNEEDLAKLINRSWRLLGSSFPIRPVLEVSKTNPDLFPWSYDLRFELDTPFRTDYALPLPSGEPYRSPNIGHLFTAHVLTRDFRERLGRQRAMAVEAQAFVQTARSKAAQEFIDGPSEKRTLLITGPPGSGKTSIGKHLYELLEDRNPQAIWIDYPRGFVGTIFELVSELSDSYENNASFREIRNRLRNSMKGYGSSEYVSVLKEIFQTISHQLEEGDKQYIFIDESSSVTEDLEALTVKPPANIRLVVMSRVVGHPADHQPWVQPVVLSDIAERFADSDRSTSGVFHKPTYDFFSNLTAKAEDGFGIIELFGLDKGQDKERLVVFTKFIKKAVSLGEVQGEKRERKRLGHEITPQFTTILSELKTQLPEKLDATMWDNLGLTLQLLFLFFDADMQIMLNVDGNKEFGHRKPFPFEIRDGLSTYNELAVWRGVTRCINSEIKAVSKKGVELYGKRNAYEDIKELLVWNPNDLGKEMLERIGETIGTYSFGLLYVRCLYQAIYHAIRSKVADPVISNPLKVRIRVHKQDCLHVWICNRGEKSENSEESNCKAHIKRLANYFLEQPRSLIKKTWDLWQHGKDDSIPYEAFGPEFGGASHPRGSESPWPHEVSADSAGRIPENPAVMEGWWHTGFVVRLLSEAEEDEE